MRYILILLLVGCYGPEKAKSDFSKAAVYDPGMAAAFCSLNYGCDTLGHDTTIYVSDSAAFNDALKMVEFENARMNAIIDSLLNVEPLDTADHTCYEIIDVLRMQIGAMRYRMAHTPAIRDSFFIKATVVDKAALEACNLDKTRLIASIGPTEALRDKYKKRSRTYLWIILACGAVIGAGAYSKIKKIFV